jgi:hypothetical protein
VSVVALDVNPLATQALLVADVLDAATGDPRPVSGATVDVPHAFAEIATGSYLVLSGRPELVLPKLATTAYVFDVTLTFPDIAPLALTLTIPAGVTLPFRPTNILVEMPPVSLQGTISEAAYPNGPIAAATVAITATNPPPALLAVRTALSLAHPATTQVAPCTSTGAAGPTTLAAPAAQAATVVSLVSTAGCGPGAALALGNPSDLEHGLITGVDSATGAVSLAAPLVRSRPMGAPAQACTISAGTRTVALARDADAGDCVLEISAALTADLVQIGSPAAEVRAVDALTDADGHWQMDGVRAIGELTVTAGASGYTSSTPLPYDVDYRQPNVIDLSLV